MAVDRAVTEALHPARMGLEPLPLGDWLKPRAGDDILLAERTRLMAAHGDNVVAALPESAATIAELADLLHARGLPIDRTPPLLHAIGRGVAEDLCILTPAEGRYRLTAGVLCFPNRWKLTEKLGGDVLAVHGPVPDYAGQLSANVDRFLDKLKSERAYVRANWGLASVPDLYLPEPVPPVDITKDTGFFLRREEQSFLKLPETGAIIFGIRTMVIPWLEVSETQRADILDTVATLSPAWLAYKSIKALL